MSHRQIENLIKPKRSMMDRMGYLVGKLATPTRIALVLAGAIAATSWVAAVRAPAGESEHYFPGPGDPRARAGWSGGGDGDQIGGRPGREILIRSGDRSMGVIVDPADAKLASEIKKIIIQGQERQKASEHEHGMKAPKLDVTDQRLAMEALAAGMGQDGR